MIEIKRDCRHFRGDIPCKPHKIYNVHCSDCEYYDKTGKNILIIKLGAIGDVIRTTPLLRKLKNEYDDARIWWLTLTPEVLPSLVDVPMGFTLKNIISLEALNFDILYNLDKDLEACALAERIKAGKKYGFGLLNNKCNPINELAYNKYLTGIFDDLNQRNDKSYPEEIFEICGYKFSGEKYILDSYSDQYKWDLDKSKKIIGLNTGCGGRWTSRLWKEENWVHLAKLLISHGYQPLFLGGEQEHEKNLKLAKESGGLYLGHFPLKQFISLVNECDLVVTGVTMAMHITIGLDKKIVLFNNIFNRNEFELYGLGEIIEPEKKCTCFFLPECKNKEYKCMDYIFPEKVFDTIKKLLKV
ncbi:MAG TPA: glycosyltransferase family 9 protein [Bacteroidota bacterium]|nr:glycosyltransferase family 9 protein [Bacteroidota bacterium]